MASHIGIRVRAHRGSNDSYHGHVRVRTCTLLKLVFQILQFVSHRQKCIHVHIDSDTNKLIQGGGRPLWSPQTHTG